MGMFGFWHFGGFLFFALVFVVPCWKIVTKAGYEGAWALLAFVPLVNVIAIWLFAFNRWPVERTSS